MVSYVCLHFHKYLPSYAKTQCMRIRNILTGLNNFCFYPRLDTIARNLRLHDSYKCCVLHKSFHLQSLFVLVTCRDKHCIARFEPTAWICNVLCTCLCNIRVCVIGRHIARFHTSGVLVLSGVISMIVFTLVHTIALRLTCKILSTNAKFGLSSLTIAFHANTDVVTPI